MGRRLYINRVVARLCASYLAVFLIVLLAISAVAYAVIAASYRSQLQPALGTPVADAAFAAAMRHVAGTIAAFDAPLVLIVAVASYVLARVSIAPLAQARQREAQFAADAAHELRTPLASIAATAQAAALDATGPAHDAFARIAATALDASALVGDLLTLMRIEAMPAAAREPVDLAPLLRAVADEFAVRARQRGLTLELDARSAIVQGEEVRLRQTMRNLLENALRHARGRVRAGTGMAGREALLYVEDDGEGVPPEARARVFERFFKAREDSGGSGLGLAICRWIARAHDGDITLEGGSRFVVRIPAVV